MTGQQTATATNTDQRLHKIVLTGLMAALCYAAFAFLKIPIPTPGGGMVALHVGNAFCVLAALSVSEVAYSKVVFASAAGPSGVRAASAAFAG